MGGGTVAKSLAVQVLLNIVKGGPVCLTAVHRTAEAIGVRSLGAHCLPKKNGATPWYTIAQGMAGVIFARSPIV